MVINMEPGDLQVPEIEDSINCDNSIFVTIELRVTRL